MFLRASKKIILICLNMPVSFFMSETVLISHSAIHFSLAILHTLLWLDIMTSAGAGYFSVWFWLIYFYKKKVLYEIIVKLIC